MADSHQEDAGQGAVAKHLVRGAAVAERHRENAGRGAVAKRLAALWRIAIGKMLPAGRCAKEKHREDANDRELHQGAAPGSSIGKPHRREGRWQERSSEC